MNRSTPRALGAIRLAAFALTAGSLSLGAETKICIAHRGASAYAPEHTLAAYRLALAMGADFIEQDLQMTSDGVLVCLHDTTLERTTDVETVFPDRFEETRRRGRTVKTWPVVRFTLAEIKRLDAGAWFDPKFAGERVPTFQEAIDLVKGKAGIYPETKAPEYYEEHGLQMVVELARVLEANGFATEEGQRATPIFVQSFSPQSLKRMRALTGKTYRLIQLVSGGQAAELMSEEGLDKVAEYAAGVGPTITILTDDRTRIEAAHRRGLLLHPYTVSTRSVQNGFPGPREFTEYLLYELGVDGVFTDYPDLFPRR